MQGTCQILDWRLIIMIEVLWFSSLQTLTVLVPGILQPAFQFIIPVIILPPVTVWVEVLAVLFCE